MDLLLQCVGGTLVAFSLVDVFLTVLVARYGTSLFSERLFYVTWRLFRAVGCSLSPRRRQRWLIYAGPAALILLLSAWILLLLVGFALLYWPLLGTSVGATQVQPTATDFLTALYISADCLTTAGNGDFMPTTPGARLITLLNCVFGITTITLAITYLVQIYNALRGRNAMALALHLSTAETGDAAEWLAGMAAGGTFEGGSADLSRVLAQLASNFEAYHFYSSLLYFHFAELHYSQARVALIVLEASALAASIIDPDKHPNFVRHGAVERLGEAGLHIARDLASIYLPPDEIENAERASDSQTAQWRQRFEGARDRLERAGVKVCSDVEGGFQLYAERRHRWDCYIRAFAAFFEEPTDGVFDSSLPVEKEKRQQREQSREHEGAQPSPAKATHSSAHSFNT